MSATILSSTTNIIWRLLELYDHDAASFFKDAGLCGITSGEAGSRLNYQINNMLWQKAGQLIDDDCFGLRAAECWHPSDLNALGYAWLASSSLRHAMHRLCRYCQMLSEGLSFAANDHIGNYVLTINYRSFAQGYAARNLCNMVILLDMCRMNHGTDLQPLAISFSNPPPSSLAQKMYRSYFKSPVIFNCAADSITFSKSSVDKALTSSNPHIAHLSDQLIINYLADLDSNNLSHQVKKIILQLLPSGKISRQQIAKKLRMSERSLQRRLQDKGRSYRKILDKTRQELAERYLADGKTSITEISFLLGFSETSAFSRAFKRWRGISPHLARYPQV